MHATGFSAIVARSLGDAVRELDPRILARFVDEGQGVVFGGVMQIVACSPVGWLLARLLARMSLLPHHCASDVPTTFAITHLSGQLIKQRTYRFGKRNLFTFQSTVGVTPVLHEQFQGPFGMRLALDVVDGALRFCDDGYFIVVGRRRVRLPFGGILPRFELIHASMSSRRFAVVLRISHALLGTLFVQRGEFERVSTTTLMGRSASEPRELDATYIVA